MDIELIELPRESVLKIIQPILGNGQIYQLGLEMARSETGLDNNDLEHCLVYANISEADEPDQLSPLGSDPDDSLFGFLHTRYWAAILDNQGFHSLSGPLLSTDCSYRKTLLKKTIDLYLSQYQEPYRIITHASAIENTNVHEILQELNP